MMQDRLAEASDETLQYFKRALFFYALHLDET